MTRAEVVEVANGGAGLLALTSPFAERRRSTSTRTRSTIAETSLMTGAAWRRST